MTQMLNIDRILITCSQVSVFMIFQVVRNVNVDVNVSIFG